MQLSKVIVLENQSIYDIAVNLFGSVDGIEILMRYNTIDVAPLYPGQVLYYMPQELNKQVLKTYNEVGYSASTSGDMINAPIPEPLPSSDQVILTYFNNEQVTLEAPTEFNVPSSTVVDEDNVVLANLSPGETYQVIPEDVFVTIIFPDESTQDVAAPGTFVIQFSIVRNHRNELISSLSSGDELVLQPAQVLDETNQILAELAPGDTYQVAATGGGEVTIVFPDASTQQVSAPGTFIIEESTVNNHRSELVGILSPGQVITLDAAIVKRSDNETLTELAPGDEYYVPDAVVLSGGNAYAQVMPGQELNLPFSLVKSNGNTIAELNPGDVFNVDAVVFGQAAAVEMRIEVQNDSGNPTITILADNIVSVDWGDGSPQLVGPTQSADHEYQSSGPFLCRVLSFATGTLNLSGNGIKNVSRLGFGIDVLVIDFGPNHDGSVPFWLPSTVSSVYITGSTFNLPVLPTCQSVGVLSLRFTAIDLENIKKILRNRIDSPQQGGFIILDNLVNTIIYDQEANDMISLLQGRGVNFIL